MPCHDQFRLDTADRDWRAVGVKTDDGVRRKSTRCPECKVTYTAFERTIGAAHTVEWLQSVPFRVTAAPLTGAGLPVWQDLIPSTQGVEAQDPANLADLQERTADLPQWERSVQLVTFATTVSAGGTVFAVPGDVLLERREKWNAQDRRLALLWSPRLDGPVVAWHSFARLPQL